MRSMIMLIGGLLLTLGLPFPVHADAVDDLLAGYRALGAEGFRADSGAMLWNRTFKDAGTGRPRSCGTCHGNDLRRPGQHVRTGKRIDPMAPSANSSRLTRAKALEKWLKRNCQWTLGRECTPQEKGDLLLYLREQ